MFTCQNGHPIKADNGKRYAFGLGTRKRPVELRYDVENDELLASYRGDGWFRVSECEGCTFREIDEYGVEVPVVEEDVAYLRSRVAELESRAAKCREQLLMVYNSLTAPRHSDTVLSEDDRDYLHRFIYDGEGDRERVLDILIGSPVCAA